MGEQQIYSALPTDVKLKISQYNTNLQKNKEFSEKVATFVGTKYVYGGKSRVGIDCSGLITVSLNEMGYEEGVVSAKQMASGSVEWIEINPNASNKNVGKPGMLNFYKVGNSKNINHTNVGVGNQGFPGVPYIYKDQIVDATEGNSLTQRTGRAGQYGNPKIRASKSNICTFFY